MEETVSITFGACASSGIEVAALRSFALTTRLLICRPEGGLNDMFNQIERCCRYAERFDRDVVVDTRAVECFRDDLSDYFESLQPRLALSMRALDPSIAGLEAIPACLSGRALGYVARYDLGLFRWVEAASGEPLTFDFESDHDAPVLLHHADGGGSLAVHALARMRLRPGLKAQLAERLAAIGGRYVGVHVRNTDYRTNYEAGGLADRLAGGAPIFLATDNRRVVERFRAEFGERVFSFAALPDPRIGAIHHWGEAPDKRRLNEDAILDLVMLGMASELHIFELLPNFQRQTYSGFSRLAANLNRNPPVVDQLRSTAFPGWT